MEKIKSALAKAKSNNVQAKKRVMSPELSNINQTDMENEDSLSAINYTKTKTFELDALHLERNRIVALNKESSWAFDSLRTQVLQKMQENNWKTIAIVSPTPESGKSFVAINLAISIATQPQKSVMLVDFDLRRPRVAKYLGLQAEKSLNEYLENRCELQEALINPGLPRFVVLPTMKPVKNPAEMLSSSRVNNLIQELSERYDSRIVIYDLPPILHADDALIMLRKVDCALFVVANGSVKETEIEDAMHHIPKEKLLGVVLNRAEVNSESYYY